MSKLMRRVAGAAMMASLPAAGSNFTTRSPRPIVKATLLPLWPMVAVLVGAAVLSTPVVAGEAGATSHGNVVVKAATTDAFRFLTQASFGPTAAELARVQALGIPAYLEDQFTQPASGYPDSQYTYLSLKTTVDCNNRDPSGNAYPASAPQAICYRDNLTPTAMQRQFFTNAVTGSDQLRQRVAWALAQIMVISTVESDLSVAYVMARYQNILFDEAFDNFETLLKRVTLSPAMGNWLDMVNNDKPAGTRVPNENYAREVLQLFSIGLSSLKPDGTPVLDAQGVPVPTYDQDTVKQFARVFTGWTYPPATGVVTTGKNAANYVSPMVPYPNGHDVAVKTLLNGATLPANQTAQADLDAAVHNIFMHANVGPFIGKQLIQHLVTSNPSPSYVARVAAAFNNNGQGTRGDMKAVLRAILLDSEARGEVKTDANYGQLREPVLMLTALLRATGGTTDGASLADRVATLGERPFSSPSVFNFYPPDYTIPETSLTGPEFAIHNTSTAVGRSNLVYTLIYGGVAADTTVPNAIGTHITTTSLESSASDPNALASRVEMMLVGAPLASLQHAIVAKAVTLVPATNVVERVRMAMYLIGSSYYFQVQH
jgi:uncharacterized protein (DUF1800 family)